MIKYIVHYQLCADESKFDGISLIHGATAT